VGVVSRDYLAGPSWELAGDDRDAYGVVLLVVHAGAGRHCLATRDIYLPLIKDGVRQHFQGGIVNDPKLEVSVDPFDRDLVLASAGFEVMGDCMPYNEMRDVGIVLQEADADVYWHVNGLGHSLDQAYHYLRGKITNVSYSEKDDVVSFEVRDARLDGMPPFPPAVAYDDGIDDGTWTLEPTNSGMAYPVVIGDAEMLPVIKLTRAVGNDRYIVAHDPHQEYTGAPVTDLYDGDDDTVVIAGQGSDTDANGVPYWYVETAAGACSTGEVSVDFSGHAPATVYETINYLLRSFSGDPDLLTVQAMERLRTYFSGITLGMILNDQVDDGVMSVVRERLCAQLPIAMVQRGLRYAFDFVSWEPPIVKHLSYAHNIVRQAYEPEEMSRRRLYNSFTVQWGRSARRGDFLGTVVKDWDNDYDCAMSASRYGKRMMQPVLAPDIADQESAEWLANWLVRAHSRLRVRAGYLVGLECVNVPLLRGVSVDDEHEGWDHQPEFLVTGVSRMDGPLMRLDLLSLRDWIDVYNVGR